MCWHHWTQPEALCSQAGHPSIPFFKKLKWNLPELFTWIRWTVRSEVNSQVHCDRTSPRRSLVQLVLVLMARCRSPRDEALYQSLYWISVKWRHAMVMSQLQFLPSLVAARHSEGQDEHVDERWHQICWVGGMLKVRWDHLSMQGMINCFLSFGKDCQSALEQINKPMRTFTPVILTLLHTLMRKHQLHPLLVCWDTEELLHPSPVAAASAVSRSCHLLCVSTGFFCTGTAVTKASSVLGPKLYGMHPCCRVWSFFVQF